MEHNQNLFSVTGQFDAQYIQIRNANHHLITIIFSSEHAERIASLRDGQTVNAIGQICSPTWNRPFCFENGPSPENVVLDVTQVITFSAEKSTNLEGQFDAKIIGWGDFDGMFAICKTLEGKRVNCCVPAVHERLARARPDHMIGLYVRFYCRYDGQCLIAHKIKTIDLLPKNTLAISPNKACQAWDKFVREGKPKRQVKTSRGVSARLRRSVFMRDGFKCRECGASPDQGPVFLEVDHIIPFSRGGNSEERNLQTLCSKCNGAKSDGMPNPATMEALIV